MPEPKDRQCTGWHFGSARDLFESAREASLDAEHIRRQLVAMEERALSPGGGGDGPVVRGTPDPQRSSRRADALLDREESLRRRQEDDYRLIDLASWVLYGTDNETGLASLVPAWWCDALWWHYLDCASWRDTARAVGYSEQRCKQVRDLALDTVDSWGIVDTMQGRALNDFDTWERDELRRREKALTDVKSAGRRL